MKKIFTAMLAMLLLAVLGACGAKNDDSESEPQTYRAETAQTIALDQLTLPTIPAKENSTVKTPWKPGDKYPVITITIGNLGTFRGGTITAELYPDKAPNTVNNFISLVKSGYFTGRVFHRAAPGFMIQGGSPNGDGLSTGFPYAIPGEFANAGFAQNDLKHTPGVLSMARMGAPYGQDPTPFYHTASCQFFIMHANYPSLDGDYAAFGKVTSGMDIVDRVANQPADGNMILLEKPVITGMTVETFGLDYPAPETVAAP